jgi:hypothetical protein
MIYVKTMNLFCLMIGLKGILCSVNLNEIINLNLPFDFVFFFIVLHLFGLHFR